MKNDLVSIVVLSRDRKIELVNCITSLQKNDYKNMEMIIVDNGSKEKITKSWFGKSTNLMVKRLDENIGAAGGRNYGFSFAKGKYVLFMDDDAIADIHMISELIVGLRTSLHAGIVQPKIYEKNNKKKLQGIGHDINPWTGRVIGIGIGEIDIGQFDSIQEIPMAGCIWMIMREVFVECGKLDAEYFIPYEDSDFCFRVRKKGYKVYFIPNAIAWHTAHKSVLDPRIEWLGITSSERAYRIARNKIIFLKKNDTNAQFTFFLLCLLPLYSIIHSCIIISANRFDILRQYWKGLLSGIRYSVTFKSV